MKRQKVTNICDLQMSVSGAGLGREEGAERERERQREREQRKMNMVVQYARLQGRDTGWGNGVPNTLNF